jgi:hypothetical protein
MYIYVLDGILFCELGEASHGVYTTVGNRR